MTTTPTPAANPTRMSHPSAADTTLCVFGAGRHTHGLKPAQSLPSLGFSSRPDRGKAQLRDRPDLRSAVATLVGEGRPRRSVSSNGNREASLYSSQQIGRRYARTITPAGDKTLSSSPRPSTSRSLPASVMVSQPPPEAQNTLQAASSIMGNRPKPLPAVRQEGGARELRLIQVTVFVGGRSQTLSLPSSATVGDLKDFVEIGFQVSRVAQRIYFQGRFIFAFCQGGQPYRLYPRLGRLCRLSVGCGGYFLQRRCVQEQDFLMSFSFNGPG